ncbi:hypothetical protein IV203_004488 [Nitzschia inconspicua]|uniref:BED-type domain-containing protein n=1 Tax=Nitzschia inconspicua TaxID=303405 RepID=A0A9K3L4E4_9STRA|nr:hypothetical protein IV203_004488 [Nitzschia inconspicua]
MFEYNDDDTGHARVDDPILPPARMLNNVSLSTSIGGNGDSTSQSRGDSILSRLYDPDRKQRPELWAHIKLVAPSSNPPPGMLKWRSQDAVAAYCLKCKKQFTYTKGTSQTISRHMVAFHGMSTRKSDNKNKDDGSDMDHSTQEDGPPPMKKRNVNERSQIGTRDRSTSSPPTVVTRTAALLRWLIGSYHPLDLVHSTAASSMGFAAFCGSLNSNFNLPPFQNLVSLADQRYKAIQDQLRLHIHRKDFEYLSVSVRRVNVCHVSNKGHPQNPTDQGTTTYFPVLFTFCTPHFGRKSMTAAVIKCDTVDKNQPLTEYDAVDKALSMLGVDKENVASLCVLPQVDSENGSKITAKESWIETNLTAWQQMSCVVDQMDGLVTECFTAYFKEVFSVKLESLVSNQDTTNDRLSHQIYRMLESSNELDGHDISFVRPQLLAILAPFKDAMVTLSSDVCPTIGLTCSILRRVQSVLNGRNVNEAMENSSNNERRSNEMMQGLLDKIRGKFSTAFGALVEVDSSALWTVPLDPRLILMNGLSESEKEKVKSTLCSSVKSLVLNDLASEDSTAENNENAPSTSTMGGLFLGDRKDQTPKSIDEAEAYATSNVDSYFTAVSSQRRINDPLVWWNHNHASFPELATLARKWMATSTIYAVPTINPAEREKVIRIKCEDEKDVVQMIYLHENQRLI